MSTARVAVPSSAWCERCGRVTATALLPLSSGHTGNACATCRTLRKGRPYVSRHASIESPMPHRAEGAHELTPRV